MPAWTQSFRPAAPDPAKAAGRAPPRPRRTLARGLRAPSLVRVLVRVLAGVLAALLVAAPVRGDDLPGHAAATVRETPRPAPAARPRYGRAALETVAVLAGSTVWYWANTNLNSQDWELHWDWPSWREKLFTLDAIRFDSNEFLINAQKHPIGGVIHYQIGRANGFGMGGSLALDAATAVFWEYVVELKEVVSLNDLVVNTAAGVSIGEPLVQPRSGPRRSCCHPSTSSTTWWTGGRGGSGRSPGTASACPPAPAPRAST